MKFVVAHITRSLCSPIIHQHKLQRLPTSLAQRYGREWEQEVLVYFCRWLLHIFHTARVSRGTMWQSKCVFFSRLLYLCGGKWILHRTVWRWLYNNNDDDNNGSSWSMRRLFVFTLLASIPRRRTFMVSLIFRQCGDPRINIAVVLTQIPSLYPS